MARVGRLPTEAKTLGPYFADLTAHQKDGPDAIKTKYLDCGVR